MKSRKPTLTSGTAAIFATAVAAMGDAPTAKQVDDRARFYGFVHNHLTSIRDNSSRWAPDTVTLTYVFPDGSQADVSVGDLSKEDRVFKLVPPPVKKRTSKRLTGLGYTRSKDDVSRMSRDYEAWLCQQRGWFTTTRTCDKCHGGLTVYPDHGSKTTSQMRTWKKNRTKAGLPHYLTENDKITCPRCDGTGIIPTKSGNTELDLKRAESYVAEQRSRLEKIAEDAVKAIKAKLYAAGFRRVLLSWTNPETVEEYDRLEAEHAARKVEFEHERELEHLARQVEEARFFTLSAEEQLKEMNEWPHPVRLYKQHEERANELQREMHAWNPSHGFYYRPGVKRVIWVGTGNQPRYYGSPNADVKVIIEPGRAPNADEIELLAADAIAEYEPAAALLAA